MSPAKRLVPPLVLRLSLPHGQASSSNPKPYPHPYNLQVVVARAGFPGETLQALRFLLASPSDAGAQASSSNGGGDPSAYASPGSPELEARLARVLVHACEHELRSLGEWDGDACRLGGLESGSGVRESGWSPGWNWDCPWTSRFV